MHSHKIRLPDDVHEDNGDVTVRADFARTWLLGSTSLEKCAGDSSDLVYDARSL